MTTTEILIKRGIFAARLTLFLRVFLPTFSGAGPGNYYQTQAMIGKIDNFAVWTSSLTSQQIKQLSHMYQDTAQ